MKSSSWGMSTCLIQTSLFLQWWQQPLAEEMGEQVGQAMSSTTIVAYCCVQKWIPQPLSHFAFAKWGDSAVRTRYTKKDGSN